MDGRMDAGRAGWMDACMEGWMEGLMEGWMDGWMEGRVDGWRDGGVGGWMDGCMDGWMDGMKIDTTSERNAQKESHASKTSSKARKRDARANQKQRATSLLDIYSRRGSCNMPRRL